MQAQGLGDTVLVEGDTGLAAFAICHYGPRSEAGAGTCFIKFAAVRDTPFAARDYSRLLDACEALAVSVGMSSLLAGGEPGAPRGDSESGGARLPYRDPGRQHASAE